MGRLFSAREGEALVRVMRMGFPKDEVLLALIEAGWDAEAAAGELAMRAGPAPAVVAHVDHGQPPLEMGYTVLRVPEASSIMRGRHRCDWGALLRRLRIPRQEWPQRKAGYYIRLYKSQEEAEEQWRAQRLSLPIPIDPTWA